MTDDWYDIKLWGFAEWVQDPASNLAEMFGISTAWAQAYLDGLPVVVKRGATGDHARAYIMALHRIGAFITVQENVTNTEFAYYPPETDPNVSAATTPFAEETDTNPYNKIPEDVVPVAPEGPDTSTKPAAPPRVTTWQPNNVENPFEVLVEQAFIIPGESW